MANIRELDLLGRKFIELEIEILNDTNTSIYENGIYNERYLKIKEWEKGIKEFLMYENFRPKTPLDSTKLFYRSLAELVNKAYIRYKELISNVDRLSLKAYLQICEILDQEQKIIELGRYQSSKEVIEAQEHLNKIVLNSYNAQLKMIQDVMKSEELQKALDIVIKGKDKEDIKKSFDDKWWQTMEHLNELIQPQNKQKLEAEIQEAQNSIKEAQERQQSYDKQKEKRKKIEELKKNKNAVENFFNNKSAVDSTITVLTDCCYYFYNLIFLKEFMASLSIIEIHNQFYFMNPLELMSYDKLQGGLMDLMALLECKGINNEEFTKIANKFISLEFLDVNKKISYAGDEIESEIKEYRSIITDLREKLSIAFMRKNRNHIIHSACSLENDFIHTLKEKGW